jgi:hypothetical protein
MYQEKTIMWKKAEKDEKAPPAFLMGKNFESGTLAFRLIFGKEDSILSLYIKDYPPR